MNKNILTKTNLLVCLVIFIGFAIAALISYHSNIKLFMKDIEDISYLTLEGIYCGITIF